MGSFFNSLSCSTAHISRLCENWPLEPSCTSLYMLWLTSIGNSIVVPLSNILISARMSYQQSDHENISHRWFISLTGFCQYLFFVPWLCNYKFKYLFEVRPRADTLILNPHNDRNHGCHGHWNPEYSVSVRWVVGLYPTQDMNNLCFRPFLSRLSLCSYFRNNGIV
jgi:hypothetical protein